MELVSKSKITIHPRAIQAMGADLVTDDNIAILELVKNSYDAFAYNVVVEFGHDNSYLKIIDDGLGMSLDVLENAWGKISTTYKKENTQIRRNNRVRIVSGNKGMGRLSAARLGDKLTIITKEIGKPSYQAVFRWKEFYSKDSTDECDYEIYKIDGTEYFNKETGKDCGTILIIENLLSDWKDVVKSKKTEENIKITNLKVELGRILNPFAINDFSIKLMNMNRPIDLFNFNDNSEDLVVHPLVSKPPYKIIGEVDENQNLRYKFTVIKQFKNNEERRVFESSERLVTWDEIKKRVDSSYDDLVYHDDVTCGKFKFEIRMWDLDSESLKSIVSEFANNNANKLTSTKTVRDILKSHKGISVYRDNVLVLPKSENSKDWLGLDKKRIGRVGSNISTSQLIGKIEISLKENPNIEDTTSREDFNINREYQNFHIICLKGIIEELKNLRINEKSKDKKDSNLRNIFDEVSPKKLKDAVNTAIEDNKSPEEIKTLVDKYSDELDKNLNDLQERIEYYAQLATAGTFSKLLIHELRSNVNPIQRFNRNVVKAHGPFEGNLLKYYDFAVNGVERLINLSDVFSPLSRFNFKKESHSCEAYNELENVKSLMSQYLIDNKISVENNIPKDIFVKLHSGELQTVLINLMDNAIYWTSRQKNQDKKIVIEGFTSEKVLVLQFSDNGPGIDELYRETIFNPGVTAKGGEGFGMGLVVINEIISNHGGYLKTTIPGLYKGATFEFSLPIKS